jgi:hypothetical protein
VRAHAAERVGVIVMQAVPGVKIHCIRHHMALWPHLGRLLHGTREVGDLEGNRMKREALAHSHEVLMSTIGQHPPAVDARTQPCQHTPMQRSHGMHISMQSNIHL